MVQDVYFNCIFNFSDNIAHMKSNTSMCSDNSELSLSRLKLISY